MMYLICIFGGIVLGFIGGILLAKRFSRENTGGIGAIPLEQYERIKAVLKHIEEGDKLIEEIDELLGKKQ